MKLNLPIASYRDAPSVSTRLVNCYVELPGEQAIGPQARGFPGLTDYKTPGDGPLRGGIVVHGVKYVVSGDELWKITRAGAVSLIGDVSGTARPQFASNGIEVVVCIEPRAWVYTIGSGAFAEITDTDFTSRGASSVQFIDNYLSFTEPDSGRWFISDLAAATSYDSLNFATAEGSPDNLVTHVVDHRQAILLGVESFEIWDNAGISGFPFVRSGNGFGEMGCLAPYSACKVNQSVHWLANDGTVRWLQGVTAVRISSHALERAIRSYTATEAVGHSITWEGHLWYVLTFPEATWVFDVTTQQWFELESSGLDNWRGAFVIQDGGRTYVGDSQSNKLGLLDDVFAEFGETSVMTWQYPNVYGENRPAIHHRLEMVFQSGVGLSSGQGSAPEVMLALSDDGGQSFTNLPTRLLGAQGHREARVVWDRLGQSTNRVYRGSISDPVRRKLIDTSVIVEGGRL